MQRIKLTADTPNDLRIWEIEQELLEFISILDKKYDSIDFEFWFCFRALHESTISSGWTSKVTFYKRYNALSFDIIMAEKEFLRHDMLQQKKVMGTYFFPLFEKTIVKYAKKIPSLKPVAGNLIDDMRLFLTNKKWL